MSRVVVTGVGCINAAGVGAAALTAALCEGRPLGRIERVETLRGRQRELRVARIAPFDRESFLPAHKLRRMGELSQVWTIVCLLAHVDAGLDRTHAASPPERRGTFLGTGFGCIRTTWEYLEGLFHDGAGMASPFLFSESVANAPAGHSAIELDTRGASVSFTCGDASAAAAVAAGARAIRDGRLALAYCGGVELLSPPLLRVLAALGAPRFLGEGCACLVLESLEAARARGARIHAEVAGAASASDPACRPTEWSRDTAAMTSVMRRTVEQSPSARPAKIFLHACGSSAADDAEARAALAVGPDAATVRTSAVLGSLTAAGGANLTAAVLDAGRLPAAALVSASSWGGGLFCVALSSGPV